MQLLKFSPRIFVWPWCSGIKDNWFPNNRFSLPSKCCVDVCGEMVMWMTSVHNLEGPLKIESMNPICNLYTMYLVCVYLLNKH